AIDSVGYDPAAWAGRLGQASRAASRLDDGGREQKAERPERPALELPAPPLPLLMLVVDVVSDVAQHDRVANLQTGDKSGVPGVSVQEIGPPSPQVEPQDR